MQHVERTIVKELNEQVAPILTSILFSKSLESEEIHKDWKHANVAQTYKEGEKYEAVN